MYNCTSKKEKEGNKRIKRGERKKERKILTEFDVPEYNNNWLGLVLSQKFLRQERC